MRGITLADAWRSFRTAIGLGWAIESNWSDPFLFAVYTMAKPLAAAGILVVMFQVITAGPEHGVPPVPDRRQRALERRLRRDGRPGAVDPRGPRAVPDAEVRRRHAASLFPFLLGRSLARVVVSFVAVALTLLVGVVFLGVELRPNCPHPRASHACSASWPSSALGIFMAGWCLQLRQEAWHYPEAIAGALYLVSGAIFPIDVLPSIASPDRLCRADDLVAGGVAPRPARPRIAGRDGRAAGRRGHALPGR